MTLRGRKLIVLILVGLVLLLGNFILVANWLQEKGVIDWARDIRREYLTGTAISIIVVLLILLVAPRSGSVMLKFLVAKLLSRDFFTTCASRICLNGAIAPRANAPSLPRTPLPLSASMRPNEAAGKTVAPAANPPATPAA